jgi:hypothetical protein
MKTKAALFLLMVIAFSCHLAGAEEPGQYARLRAT